MKPALDQQNAIPGPDDTYVTVLENGIKILVRPNFTSPSVVVDGILRGGAILESPDKAGLANFHGALLTRGTENYSFADFFEEIEANGASLSANAERNVYSFGSKSLAEDLPRMLGLLSEVLQRPTFPEEYIERVRAQLLTRLRLREQNTRSMASLKFYETAYPEGHPYTVSTSGYIDTVSSITRDDIVEFQQNIGPRDAIIVIVGAVEVDTAVNAVKEALGSWENPNQPQAPEVPDAPSLTDVTQVETLVPGKSQADVVLGFPGPRRRDPDYTAARLGNSILGVFGMYGRLGDNIREGQGLAYYSFSRVRGGLGPGPWSVSAGVAPENVEKAVDSIREELKTFVDTPVTEEEISDNKSYFKGGLVLGLETNEGVASTLLSMEIHNLGLDYLQKYAETIDSITVEDIQRVAQRFITPDAYTLSIAGPKRD